MQKRTDYILNGLVPSLESMQKKQEDFIFQDDSAPSHRACSVVTANVLIIV